MWPLFTTWSGGEIRISADQTGGRFPPSARRFFSGGRPVDFAPDVGHVIQIAIGVRHVHVDGGRKHAAAHGQQGGRRWRTCSFETSSSRPNATALLQLFLTCAMWRVAVRDDKNNPPQGAETADRKSTRLNSSHLGISYAV